MKRSPLLLAIFAACLLNACATQTYEPRPIEPAQLAARFRARALDGVELHNYMLAQGYPQNALPIKSWGLRELTLAAFVFHPQLEVARAQLQASRAAIITAGHKPNPGISGAAEHHSKADGGISPWTLSFSLDLPIDTGGKREARIEHAGSLAEAARLEIGQTVWEIRSRLRGSLAEYFTAVQRTGLLQREVDIRHEIVAMLEARLAAGMISDIDLANARLQLQTVQQALEAEKGRIPELRAAVAAAVGLPEQALASIQIAPLPDPVNPRERLPDAEVQRAALLNRLDIRAALARYAAAEAALKLEIARQRPDIVLSPGYSFDQGDNRWSLGLSLLLALLHKNEGPIAEAAARREAEAAQFNALQARVIGEEEQALARYRAALEELVKAERLLTAQRQRYAQSERQFEAGYSDRLELAGVRLETLGAEQGVSSAGIKLQRALGALEDAVQRPLDGTALPAAPESGEPQS